MNPAILDFTPEQKEHLRRRLRSHLTDHPTFRTSKWMVDVEQFEDVARGNRDLQEAIASINNLVDWLTSEEDEDDHEH